MVDPACGSGSCLLGMMRELIELQVRLFNVTQDAKSLYDLKLEIIQRNLYGVDIDDFAVNIAMLRCGCRWPSTTRATRLLGSVPKLSATKRRPLVRLVGRILEAKAADPDADTRELERETDRLVYAQYGLTEEETAAVESG